MGGEETPCWGDAVMAGHPEIDERDGEGGLGLSAGADGSVAEGPGSPGPRWVDREGVADVEGCDVPAGDDEDE